MLLTQEIQVRFLGRVDALEKEMATHSNFLAWKIPWTVEPGGLQSVRSQGGDTIEVTSHTHTHRGWVVRATVSP